MQVGNVDLKGGGDFVIINETKDFGTGNTISGGSGDGDELRVRGDATVDGAIYIEFESLDVESGTTTLKGTQTYLGGVKLIATNP